MMLIRVGLLVTSLLLSSSLIAEAATTGSIRGIVQDEEGQPLPGAAVVISSKALITNTSETASNQSGVFRFPSIPIGVYTVQAMLEGFETARVERVEVRLDSTVVVPITMRLARLAEVLSVVGEGPILDATRTEISSSFKNEMLSEVPTRRQFYNLIQLAPGVSAQLEDTAITSATIAFGSNLQSSAWLVDGVNITLPEVGISYLSPVAVDDIEEIQVIGIGASAEYGNHTGAVFNVVTKRGGNVFHGGADYYFQTDSLTGENVRLPDSPYVFHRDFLRNFAAQLGGPIRKDKIWFFASGEYVHDSYSEPGNNPEFPSDNGDDKYNFKVSAASENHQFNVFTSGQLIDNTYVSEFVTPSAQPRFRSPVPSWGGGWTATMHQNLLLELNYAGWRGTAPFVSRTGSLEDPFFDSTPPDGGPTRYSGGVLYPWDMLTWRHQVSGTLTYYADNFLKKHHEFKFGVQFSDGLSRNIAGIGPNGSYTYSSNGYLYKAVQEPFYYGGSSTYLAGFIDDSVSINDRLNLNLGVRYDHIRGSIPDYPQLTVGAPSITSIGNFKPTGQTIPGVDDLIRWDLISPRVGFTYQPRRDGRAVVNASFGVYYDQNVIANWEFPPPQTPSLNIFAKNPDTGLFDILFRHQSFSDTSTNFGLRPPRTLQYSIGYQQEIGKDSAFGIQYVFKDTKNLIGWEILGGQWAPYAFADPFTGKEYTLLDQVSPPLLRRGNNPGDFPGSEGLRYFQKYHALLLTYNKRFTNSFGLNASYTWSRSTGLLPRMLLDWQGVGLYRSREGSDPNNFINAEGRLQGDRPHMFRLQAVLQKLPWDLQTSVSVDFSSGRAHSRQVDVQIVIDGVNKGLTTVIMEPTGAYRLSAVRSIDLSIGKQIPIGSVRVRLEGWILNLLNADYETQLAALTLNSPGEDFVPISWAKPRRLQVRIGFEF